MAGRWLKHHTAWAAELVRVPLGFCPGLPACARRDASMLARKSSCNEFSQPEARPQRSPTIGAKGGPTSMIVGSHVH
jgi:hypothetical protein